MPAHFQNSQRSRLSILPIYTNAYELLLPFAVWRWRQYFTSLQVMLYFVKNPRITNCCPTNHNTIYTIAVLIFQCFLRTINITVAKYRYMNIVDCFLPLQSAANRQCLYTTAPLYAHEWKVPEYHNPAAVMLLLLY